MAGILFTNNNYALVGYDSRKERITGIGGKKQGTELPYETALRETIEEIFEFSYISPVVLKHVSENIIFDSCISNGEYTTYIMTFKDLERIIEVLSIYDFRSKVYSKFPMSITELIFNRIPNIDAELKWLMIVPIENNIKFSRSLLIDIETFNSMK